MSVTLVSAVYLALGMASTDSPSPKIGAVVIADFSEGEWLDTPPCPDDSICLNGLYRATFRTRKILAGSGVPRFFLGQLWLHTLPKRHRMALLLKKEAGGWEIVGKSGADHACFDAATAQELGLEGLRASNVSEVRCFLESPTNR